MRSIGEYLSIAAPSEGLVHLNSVATITALHRLCGQIDRLLDSSKITLGTEVLASTSISVLSQVDINSLFLCDSTSLHLHIIFRMTRKVCT